MIRLRAPAKLNLALEVIGRRADGYHQLISVVQTVDICDELEVRQSPRIKFNCSDEGLARGNLVERAAVLLAGHAQGKGCAVSLTKRIPVGAGLGGGSSDAAATLIGVAQLWRAELDCEWMLNAAERLGSDVPYFLYGGTCLVEGRGEKVSRLPPVTSWFLLVNPGIRVSTAAVFAELRRDEWSQGDATREVATSIERSGKIALGPNSLRDPLFRRFPEAQVCFDAVDRAVHGGARISGSGPTVFSQFANREEALALARDLARFGYWTAVCRSWTPPENWSPCT